MRLDAKYSREPGEEKQYTGDIMKTEKVEQVLTPIIESENSHVYVCGSAQMLEMCKSAMIEMTSKFHVKNLIEEGRLHCDVFGALNPAGSGIARRTSEGMHGELSSRRNRVRNRVSRSHRHSTCY